ncbi:MAG TPA: alkaline phosphatase family protein [Candidatus Binatia bacterium]|nr:alkaline phosphatase family protein [Candidatus Binatia bacterium]
MRFLPVLLFLLAACVHAPRWERGERAHVYLVVVDGLGARFATPDRLPVLSAAVASEPERSSVLTARAVMPARTNPNHVTLVTGVYAEAHGIVGNAFWDRTPGTAPEKLESADRIEVETLFTVAETTDPRLVTLAAFGKPKLARLFAGVPGRQRAPDVLWSSEALPPARRDPATGYASDAETMAAALDAMAAAEPDLAFLNLADVDTAGHAHGPDSPEYTAAIMNADAAIGRLVKALRARGRWRRTVLIVTADHGMSAVGPPVSLGAALGAAGVRGVTVVADGGVDHVYVDALDRRATGIDGDARLLRRVASVARRVPGVSDFLGRLPCVRCRDVALIDAVHPDWHVDHERTGELLVVAAAGQQFADPTAAGDAGLLGNHGGPQDRDVPLIVTGGWPGLRAAAAGTPSPDLVDVAPTIEALLGLRAPRRVDGSAVPERDAGHPLAITTRTD